MSRQCSQPAEPKDHGRITRRQASEIREGVGEDPSKTRGEIRGRRSRQTLEQQATGARVCAELSQGMSVIPVHSVIVIKKRVRRLSHGNRGHRPQVTTVLLLDDGLASSVETDGLPLRTVTAEGKRDGVRPRGIVRVGRADAHS